MNSNPTKPGWRSLAWLLIGALLATAFSCGIFPPLEVTVVILATLSAIGIISMRVVKLSLMSRFFVLLYSLPFTATLGYLFDAEFIWTRSANVQPLCQIHDLINGMLVMAIVGLCGLLAGIEATTWFYCRFPPTVPETGTGTGVSDLSPTFSLPVTVILLGVSIYLSALHSPAKTIFEEPYAIRTAAKLNGSWLISYMILILLYLDFEREKSSPHRRWKVLGFSAAVAYIIVVLQFLRGDRECAGLVVGLAMLFVTNPATEVGTADGQRTRSRERRAMMLVMPLAISIVVFAGLGTLRNIANVSEYDDPDTRSAAVKYLTRNTWTAVCLNNLGLATDYYYGNVEYFYGRTYLDYFLSLPPSPIARRLNYVRPLDGPANPAQWYRCLISFGGMHPVVVPYRNFGIWGVIPVLFFCGSFIAFCEVQNERRLFSTRLLYGCVATSSMSWFWYSDMNMIRTLMICAGLLLFYRPWWNYRRSKDSIRSS